MPSRVPCQYARPGNPNKPHVVTEILPPHRLAGETAILGCYNQEELKHLNPGDIIFAKDNFRLQNDGKGPDYLGDALPPFMQPTSSKYIKPTSTRNPDPDRYVPLAFRETSAASSVTREEDAGFTYSIKEIELRNYEHKKIFELCVSHYGTKKEAGRRLIGFAIETLKRCSSEEFDSILQLLSK